MFRIFYWPQLIWLKRYENIYRNFRNIFCCDAKLFSRLSYCSLGKTLAVRSANLAFVTSVAHEIPVSLIDSDSCFGKLFWNRCALTFISAIILDQQGHWIQPRSSRMQSQTVDHLRLLKDHCNYLSVFVWACHASSTFKETEIYILALSTMSDSDVSSFIYE